MPPIATARRLALLVAAAAAAIASPVSATAQNYRTEHTTAHGNWATSEIARPDGTRFCMTIAQGPSSLAPHDTMGFAISVRDDGGLMVVVSKSSWSIPAGTPVRVRLQFGAASPWQT